MKSNGSLVRAGSARRVTHAMNDREEVAGRGCLQMKSTIAQVGRVEALALLGRAYW